MFPRTEVRRRFPAAVAAAAGVLVLGTGGAVAADGAAESVAAQADAQARAAAKARAAALAKARAWCDPVGGGYVLSASYGSGGARWARTHSGQDFAVPVGTRVVAVHTGTVVKAGANGAGDGPAYGNAVVIKHDDDTYSQYAHLSRVDVRPGQRVATGEVVALSGNTGNSSGPHLHFEIRTTPRFGSAVDPVAHLRAVGVRV
ncbi:M23 family metallopeptidase [Streptomyces sp. NPDC050504]|uniref:M23 family metallopeptidase n=1 Tax=Streptomyces sp. NPDC050504 TaxID=3365618 RepID=UPI0037AF5A1D